MYLVGQGADIMGPGTSLVQRINWNQAQENQMRGMGCAGLGCRGLGCGGGCGNDVRGKCSGTCAGLGLFDSGMDFTTWGWPEWAIVGVGVYAGMSLLGDTKRGVSRAGRVSKAVRKAV
jgi:hypothetical protein